MGKCLQENLKNHTNILFTINGLLKTIFCYFCFFHFSKLNMNFVKDIMKKKFITLFESSCRFLLLHIFYLEILKKKRKMTAISFQFYCHIEVRKQFKIFI